MSKKKFDPKKLNFLESINDHIDLKKAQGFADATINDILVGQNKLFTENVVNSSFYQALVLQDKALKDTKGHNLIVFIRAFSIQNPHLKIYPVYSRSVRSFYKRIPRKEIYGFHLKEQKAFSEKNYEAAEHKYLKKVIAIDWPRILYYLDDYYFYSSLLEALNRVSPEWFTEIKTSIQDIPNEIKNYFEIRKGNLFDTNNLHSTTKNNSHIRLEKTMRLYKIISEAYDEPFNDAYAGSKEYFFKDSTTQLDFENFLKGTLALFEEIKKIKISTETFQNLLNHIHTAKDSKEPKYLFLYKLLSILFPTQFTSVKEWEASRKTSAINQNGFYVKEAKETFIHEVKKFLRL